MNAPLSIYQSTINCIIEQERWRDLLDENEWSDYQQMQLIARELTSLRIELQMNAPLSIYQSAINRIIEQERWRDLLDENEWSDYQQMQLIARELTSLRIELQEKR